MTNSSTHKSCEDVCKGIHDGICGGNLINTTMVVVLVRESTRLDYCRKIREMYKQIYGQDLIDLQQQQDHRLITRPLSMLMLNPHDRDAVYTREALFPRNNGHRSIDYRALIEIYAGRKPSHFFLIQQAYHTRFRSQMDQDIINIEPPHPYQKLLIALSASQKAHYSVVSEHIAKCDAQRLFQTGEGRSGGGLDEAVVLEILSKRSIPQQKLTFSMYKHIYGHTYIKSLKNKYFGEFEEALKQVVRFIISDPPKYYAKAIRENLMGGTTENSELERVMVSRAEVDMEEIRGTYKAKYGLELRDAISGIIPPGDYRDLLVTLATKS